MKRSARSNKKTSYAEFMGVQYQPYQFRVTDFSNGEPIVNKVQKPKINPLPKKLCSQAAEYEGGGLFQDIWQSQPPDSDQPLFQLVITQQDSDNYTEEMDPSLVTNDEEPEPVPCFQLNGSSANTMLPRANMTRPYRIEQQPYQYNFEQEPSQFQSSQDWLVQTGKHSQSTQQYFRMDFQEA